MSDFGKKVGSYIRETHPLSFKFSEKKFSKTSGVMKRSGILDYTIFKDFI